MDGWNIGRMENIGGKMGWKTQFSTVWEWKENQRSGKPGETFLSRAHKIFPPKSGGKSVRGNRHDWYFTKIPTHQPSFIRLTYPAEDFCPQTHFLSFSHLSFKRPVLQVLLSFLFFLLCMIYVKNTCVKSFL